MKKQAWAAALIGVAAFSFSASAQQPVPRVKAKLLSFDGKLLTIQPLKATDAPEQGAKSAPARKSLLGPGRSIAKPDAAASPFAPTAYVPDGKPITLALIPTTKVMATAPATHADIKQDSYVGAAVTVAADGKLTARSIMLYPGDLRGTGEGRFADQDRTLVNGTVTAASPTSLSLHYRGANLNGTVCEGRAPPPALASLLACTGDAVIALAADASVSTLKPGDTNMLQPGVLLTVSLARNVQGDDITPGVIVEAPPETATAVAKPVPNP